MDSSLTELPLVGEPDTGALAALLNRLRVEAIAERGKHTGPHQECINLYLYGNESGEDAPHVYPKIQGLINSNVTNAARNIPNLCLKAAALGDGGPAVTTTAGASVILDMERITDFLQHAVDKVLERSGWKKFFRRSCFYGKLFGWQDAFVDYDHGDGRKDLPKCRFRILPALQWYKPSDVSEIEDMAYFGFDWPQDAADAKAEYPALAAKIDEESTRAVKMAPASSGYSDIYMSQTWGRPIVTMSHFWLRNRKARKVLDGFAVPAPPPAGDSGIPGAGSASGAVAGAGAGGSEGPPLPAPVTEPPAEEFETVISHTVQIMNDIVVDEVCEDWDIPVVTNYNVRVPNRPYGQSDCLRLKSQQIDINDMHESMVRHGRLFRGPTNFLPASAWDKFPEGLLKNHGIEPNKTYKLPDDVIRLLHELFGNNKWLGQYDPPAMPPVLMEVMTHLEKSFDSTGGHAEVTQGIAPTANSSGELAKVLMDAAQSQNDYSAMDLEEMAWRVGKLILGYIQQYWTVADFLQINRTYDAPTVQMIIDTARDLEWEIEVDAAVMKQQKQQQVRADVQIKDGNGQSLIDAETARDIIGYDNAQIERRQQAAQQAQMAQAAVAGASGIGPTAASKPGPGQQPGGLAPSLKLAGATA